MLTEDWFRAAAWLGSDQFDAALVRAPCGCDMERRAEREADPNAARMLAKSADAAKRAWGCKLAGCDSVALDKDHEAALAAIKRMTGWSGPPTCPRAALSHPALIEALRLLPAVEHGTLPMIDHLPNVLHEAAFAAAQGKGERWDYEQRVREKNKKAGERG